MNKELNIFTLRMLRDQYEAEHLDTEVEALDAAISAMEGPDIARDIATIIENEKDMRVIKENAEQEIIRCKDCDWWTKQEASLQGRCALNGIYPTGGWYCANAERRKDG